MTILDAVLILFLLCGAVIGFKKGAIKSLVGLVGTIAVIVISYYIKNSVADVLFKFVPFITFKGAWAGLVTLNILLYEAIAYFICFIILDAILKIILKITGIIEFLLKMTIILGIPSKIIGAVLGFVEAIFFAFIILFVLIQFNGTQEMVSDSSLANSILDKTPIVGNITDDTYKAILEIRDLTKKYENNSNKDEYNQDILKIMLKYKVVKKDVVQKLVDDKKLDFNGVQNILDNYKEND